MNVPALDELRALSRQLGFVPNSYVLQYENTALHSRLRRDGGGRIADLVRAVSTELGLPVRGKPRGRYRRGRAA